MIKFEIDETGRKRKSDGARELRVTCKVNGCNEEVQYEIVKFLEIMNERAKAPFMSALEHFFQSEIDKFIEEGEDDEE